MGGYVSVPTAVAAVRGRRPLVLHEQNAVPGLANRVLARGARSVGLSFAEAARAFPRRTGTVVTGNPVREDIVAVETDRERLAKIGFHELQLAPDKRTVVVFGGSQGALHLNRSAVDAVRHLDRDDVQVLLLTGPAHHERVLHTLRPSPGVQVGALAFLERMELAYAVADLVVARAGASTMAEITVCGLPSLLVPYPYATARHQEANARALQRAGGASVLLDEEGRLRAMAERARAWSRPDAAEALAALVLEAGRDA
jgi:UDP-N-acetylglucosamine--N-acetylmuramyl-(pentapeptide) pyrophosphoryl-undecaprenol N-acetylglucosamine transferase